MEKGHCPVSHSPYHGCPFLFEHEAGDIVDYLHSFAVEIKRVNDLPMNAGSVGESQAIDKFACMLSAYMNGRVKQAIESLKK